MRYFAYIAEQAFRSDTEGRRLFLRGGAWSRPYLIPNEETERRLFTKQLWMMRLLLGTLILGQPFLFLLVPDVMRKPLWFLGYLAAVTAVFEVVGRLVFGAELAKLTRAQARLPLRAFCADMAAKHSVAMLALRLLLAAGLVAVSLAALALGGNIVGAWLGLAFSCICGVLETYVLYLKLTGQGAANP